MANCTIDSGHDYSQMQYKFRVDIVVSEEDINKLDLGFLKKLSMALDANIDVSMKLSVMAELFKQLGR